MYVLWLSFDEWAYISKLIFTLDYNISYIHLNKRLLVIFDEQLKVRYILWRPRLLEPSRNNIHTTKYTTRALLST